MKQTVKEELTILWHAVEHWQRDNHFITRGYRRMSNSYLGDFASLFYFHNETVNIYSHLLGAVAFAIIGVVVYHKLKGRYPTATREDLFVLACFFAGAIFCLSMSGIFHIIDDHSQAVARWGNQLDYIGIVSLIWGSFIPPLYYGFIERLSLVKVYWTMISLIGLATAYATVAPKFRTPEYRAIRAALFVSMGLSGVIPVIHGMFAFGPSRMDRTISLKWLIGQGVLYTTGAVIYAMRIPESIKPGWFDLVGSSHQIFHFFVLGAAMVHLTGVLKAFHNKHRGPYAAAKLWTSSAKRIRIE